MSVTTTHWWEAGSIRVERVGRGMVLAKPPQALSLWKLAVQQEGISPCILGSILAHQIRGAFMPTLCQLALYVPNISKQDIWSSLLITALWTFLIHASIPVVWCISAFQSPFSPLGWHLKLSFSAKVSSGMIYLSTGKNIREVTKSVVFSQNPTVLFSSKFSKQPTGSNAADNFSKDFLWACTFWKW